jgi:tRNA U34 5-methylaminomethyl-2-thiouridine-forming methyltransferase MnmC
MLDPSPLVISDDGSHTIVHSVYNVPYHSLRGAIQESKVVFIQACLEALAAQRLPSIDIFEMGFGSGLNAFLTCQWALNHKLPVKYTTIEAFPLGREVVETLNYPDILGEHSTFQHLHDVSWDQMHAVNPFFSICKVFGTLEEYQSSEHFDGIYYDAFAPSAQPSLWDFPTMQKLIGFLRPGGIFTTYCAQGQLRRNLKEAGFIVERLPGPPGKREMLRGMKPKNDDKSKI